MASWGTAVSDPTFRRRPSAAAWTDHLVHDAVIDPHVPFAVGVAHHPLRSRAEREAATPLHEPERLDGFRSPDDEAELERRLARKAIVRAASWARSPLDS